MSTLHNWCSRMDICFFWVSVLLVICFFWVCTCLRTSEHKSKRIRLPRTFIDPVLVWLSVITLACGVRAAEGLRPGAGLCSTGQGVYCDAVFLPCPCERMRRASGVCLARPIERRSHTFPCERISEMSSRVPTVLFQIAFGSPAVSQVVSQNAHGLPAVSQVVSQIVFPAIGRYEHGSH